MIKLRKKRLIYVRDETGPVTIMGQEGSLFYTTNNMELWMIPGGNFVAHKLTPVDHKYSMRNGIFHPDKNTGKIIITGHYPLFYAHGYGRVWMDHRGRFHRFELSLPPWKIDDTYFNYPIKKIKYTPPTKVEKRFVRTVIINCFGCGVEVVAKSKNKKFCSMECHDHWKHMNRDAIKHMRDSGGSFTI